MLTMECEDFYNMNTSTHRGVLGESLTAFGRNTGMIFGSKPYDVNIHGREGYAGQGYLGP